MRIAPPAVLALSVVAGCASQPPQAGGGTPAATTGEAPGIAAPALDVNHDYHSYANTGDFRTKHIVLDLTVDFARRVLTGTVELRLDRLSAATDLVLDTRDLDIAKVDTATGEGAWTPTTYTIDPRDPILGSALHVALSASADRVRIQYSTRPEASGLQWVTPAQTAGKKQPFLYSQSEAIHARSWIPLQDTPGVRSTYEARIRTPKNLLAVMSAHNRPETKRDGDYRFAMKQPIPSYLIALAVGDLKFRPMSERTGVYAEPSVVRAAASEFEDTEKMVQVCEKLWGPYRWERFDLLVLPPSFPFGGMENPRLTFLTPTSIVGDKSGVSLIAHELSHSWSGNLVTNATWRDFWLNEGFTDYLTYRVMDEMYGKKRGDMERVLGQQELVEAFGQVSHAGDKALAFDQRGRDPDELFSSIPYQRGRLFLEYLEAKFGREKFEAVLRQWFDDHAFQSATTEQFIAYAGEKLLKPEPGVVTPAKVDEWVYQPAMPDDAVYAKSDAFAQVDAQREAWLAGKLKVEKIKTKAWNPHEWRHFLDGMPESLTAAQAAELERRFRFNKAADDAILCAWLKVAIRAGYKPALPVAENFVLAVGRMRYLNPVYRALAKTPDGLAFAKRVYAKAKPTYHPIAQASVERILSEKK